MKVLVTGDREYTNFSRVMAVLGTLNPATTTIIHGYARGADTLAHQAAELLGMEVHDYPAAWETLGRAAGPIRNQVMLDSESPDLVVAFHDDIARSKGTLDMLTRAHRAGVRCILVTTIGILQWPLTR